MITGDNFSISPKSFLWVVLTVLGHFGQDIPATENAEGGRLCHNHKFGVWDVYMHKCVMHFSSFEIKYACEYLQ